MTFQTLVVALELYAKETGDTKGWNMPPKWLKWEPFKSCWYVNGSCLGARDAIVRFGIGEAIDDFSKLKEGDFLNYDRTTKFGHSVIFLRYIYKGGSLGAEFRPAGETVGFEYFSSQGKTNGPGIIRAYFDGKCDESVENRDCHIIKSSLVMGRVGHPTEFRSQSDLPVAPSLLDTESLPSVPQDYVAPKFDLSEQ
jgi:hypothetical protein